MQVTAFTTIDHWNVIPDDPILPNVPYIRQDESRNGLATNTLAVNSKFQVLYDMDEQDYLFLQWLNSEDSVVPPPGTTTSTSNATANAGSSGSSNAANSSLVGIANGSANTTSEDANGSVSTPTPISTTSPAPTTVSQSLARKHPLSMELFEIIMTHLESQSYITSQLLPPPVKNQGQTNSLHRHHAELYSSDDGTGVHSLSSNDSPTDEVDQCCAVCNKKDCDSSTNAIIFCDGCNIAVHQECYGVQFIPEGPWLCRRCLISRNQTQKCLFCPSTTGAFKQLDNGYWAHVICCLFINELYFANPTYMEPIEGLLNIPKSRWKLNCYICKQKVGACIQCHRSSCVTAYHVTCARRAGLYLDFKDGIAGALSDKSTLISYCDKHCPKTWAHDHDINLGIEKTRLYYGLSESERTCPPFSSNRNKVVVSKETKAMLKSTRNEMFKWKYSESAYNAPLLYVHRLSDFLRVNKIKIDYEFHTLCDIAKYWTMKRDLAKKPLIKRADALNYGLLTQDELKQRMQFTDVIKQDVSKIGVLTNLIEAKTKLNTEITSCVIDQVEQLYFPQRSIFTFLSQQLFKGDAKLINATEPTSDENGKRITVDGHEILNLHTIYNKIENMEYEKIGELIDDVERLLHFMLDDPDTWRHTRAYRFFRGPWRNARSKIYERCLKMEKLLEDGEFEKFVDAEIELDGLNVALKEDLVSDEVAYSADAKVEEAAEKNNEEKKHVVSNRIKTDQAVDTEMLHVEKKDEEKAVHTENQVEDDASSEMQIDESTEEYRHVVPADNNKESDITHEKHVDSHESDEPVKAPETEHCTPSIIDASKEQTKTRSDLPQNVGRAETSVSTQEDHNPEPSTISPLQQNGPAAQQPSSDVIKPASETPKTKSPRKRRRWMDQFVSQFFAQQKDDDIVVEEEQDHVESSPRKKQKVASEVEQVKKSQHDGDDSAPIESEEVPRIQATSTDDTSFNETVFEDAVEPDPADDDDDSPSFKKTSVGKSIKNPQAPVLAEVVPKGVEKEDAAKSELSKMVIEETHAEVKPTSPHKKGCKVNRPLLSFVDKEDIKKQVKSDFEKHVVC
ncbi:unnamed protein product [Ambrosiozyma monospora]|uniref:Unnamed protein product n=1 Tax=Ambrosiozyma monospora TaxID=43982 RepID=A0A9W6YZM3_AMBMO|nr:unnamed protein product [Ambrosiozyma monospora]